MAAVWLVFLLMGHSVYSDDQQATKKAETVKPETVKVEVPFGAAAVWAAGLPEIQECQDGRCDPELMPGIQQALKYALNNARAALRDQESSKVKQWQKKIAELLRSAEALDPGADEPNPKTWNRIFRKFVKGSVALFANTELQKTLNDLKTFMEIPKEDIGLPWRRKSVNLPPVSKENLAQALKEYKLQSERGMEIPRVGFGTWQIEGSLCKESVLEALKMGYRHIDTAQSYENEIEVGRGIKEALETGILKSRDELFLVTKLSDPRAYNEKKANKACLKQIEMLNSTYLDVYMLHGPEGSRKNRAAWKAMEKLRDEGKIRHLGISNFDSDEPLDPLFKKARIKPDYIQNKFSVYHPGGQMATEESMLKYAEELGMAFVAYSTINPWPYLLPPMGDPHVLAIALRYQRSPAQILFRWALQLNTVIIPKSSKKTRIEENAGVLEFALSESDMRLLNGLSTLYHSAVKVQPTFLDNIYELDEIEEKKEKGKRKVATEKDEL